MACPFVCLRFTRHRLSDPLLRPGVERLLRPRVMRRPIMQQARPSDTSKASSHKPPSPLFPTMLQHPESGMQNVVLWHVLLCACCPRTSPPLRPTAPPQLGSRAICISASGVESLLHQNVMCPRIMQQVVRHKASSRTPPSPLFPTRLEHPDSGMQIVVL